jgi:hypothetical protein
VENEQKIVKKIMWFFILEKLLSGFFNWNERFVNKSQIPCVIKLILTLIDKCKMCHFECHGLKYKSISRTLNFMKDCGLNR